MAENQDPSSAAFYLGKGARIDSVKITGNVAGRDVHIGVTPAEAEGVSERAQMLELLSRVLAELEALNEAPSGLKQDAEDELKKAQAAGEAEDDSSAGREALVGAGLPRAHRDRFARGDDAGADGRDPGAAGARADVRLGSRRR